MEFFTLVRQFRVLLLVCVVWGLVVVPVSFAGTGGSTLAGNKRSSRQSSVQVLQRLVHGDRPPASLGRPGKVSFAGSPFQVTMRRVGGQNFWRLLAPYLGLADRGSLFRALPIGDSLGRVPEVQGSRILRFLRGPLSKLRVGEITTVAGTGVEGYSGDGGPPTAAQLHWPVGVAVGPDGRVHVADRGNHRVRSFVPGGLITTVAGPGQWGFSGDGGPATEAQLHGPSGVVVGVDGRVYVADRGNGRVRSFVPGGLITTVAGTGQWGFSGDGGPATEAQLHGPSGVAVGVDGRVYVPDRGNGRVRSFVPGGLITTVAGTGQEGFSGDGGPATRAQLAHPRGGAVGPDGRVYVTDSGNHAVRSFFPGGEIETVAGTGHGGFSGDGGPATEAQLNFPGGVAVGPDGRVHVADSGNHVVRSFVPGELITTVAGTGVQGFTGDSGPATAAQLSLPDGVAVRDGFLYITARGNHVVRVVRLH